MKVTLRRKELSKGKERLYLDIYNPDSGFQKRKKESMNLFIYTAPKTPIEKNHNRETLLLAEAIKAQRQIDMQNGLSGFSDKKQLRGNFIDYFEKLTKDHFVSPNVLNVESKSLIGLLLDYSEIDRKRFFNSFDS